MYLLDTLKNGLELKWGEIETTHASIDTLVDNFSKNITYLKSQPYYILTLLVSCLQGI